MYKSKQKRDTLTPRESRFCQYYVETGNRKEAAIQAGYGLLADKVGATLLQKNAIQTYIKSLENAATARSSARAGYERIAYGSIADAVRLITLEEEKIPEILDKMDLFCISEIKRPKGGGMEIKFFDRLKALEKLSQYGCKGEDNFYKALGAAASEESWEDELAEDIATSDL